MDTMELLIRNLETARAVSYKEARKWFFQDSELEDIFQGTCARVLQYPPDLEDVRDHDAFMVAHVRFHARTVAMRLRGFHNGEKRPQAVKAKGEQDTEAVGLYQHVDQEETDMIYDERILPTMPSAEDAYMATLPRAPRKDIRGAMEGLTERQRTAVTLKFYEELDEADIAIKMGLTPKQVSNALSQGLYRMRNALGR